ncbi:MAG: UvrD-helicase domain-containing protein [Thermodesulfobacteriota bacterium]
MRNIHIITASAGSGKTYRLSTLLHERITAGSVRPEAVIATTFTRKAAAELSERVRRHLIAGNLIEEANRLAAARMGTINSVCGRLISDFAFEQGIFPEAGVLDEAAANREVRRAISSVVTQDRARQLTELENRLTSFNWSESVRDIIGLARSNGLTTADLEKSKAHSRESIRYLLGRTSTAKAAADLEQSVKDELAALIPQIDLDEDTTKGTKSALDFCQNTLTQMQQGRPIAWAAWLKLTNPGFGKKSAELAQPLMALAAAHDSHPGLKQDLDDAIGLVFDIAIATLDIYQEHKRLWGVVDFTDQEVLMLELLDRPEVVSRLQGHIDLLLVDEFQDTSPIQLAILLKLAGISKETVWVGDQKQSIYGFRGTDPALMDTCLAEIVKNRRPEILDKSWRSRPPLVKLTSDVFSRAFARHGIPEDMIRLSPAHQKDDPDLGPTVEWWTITSSGRASQTQDAAALADGIRKLLNDPNTRVRDKATGATRPVKPGDIAILCRSHDVGRKTAAALESLNIRAVLPRTGLLNTPEIMAVMAGLRLWVDVRDSLAAAELARLFHFPDAPGQWLETLLKNPGAPAFADLPEITAIIAQSQLHPAAGIEQSLDRVCRAVNIRKWCLAWGDAAERFANLDSLKAHARNYINACFEEGIGCTPAGLIAHLYDLNANEEDSRAPVTGENAVNIVTWHACKGLEWPITVLAQIGKTFDPDPLGVQVVNNWRTFSLDNPLADRLLRFWISPYHERTKNSAFHDRLQNHPSMAETARQHNRQELRLLYVGWTRARDRLILAGREKEFSSGILAMLVDDQNQWLLCPPDKNKATWAGKKIDIHTRVLNPVDPEPRQTIPGKDYPDVCPPLQDSGHPPARLSPSAIPGTGRIISLEKISDRLPLADQADMTALGEAIHTFYAADRLGLEKTARLTLAADILHRWQTAASLTPEHLLQSADALTAWVDRNYPNASWKKEMPILHRLDNGTLISGFIDLLLETPEQLVIIDHKAFPGSQDEVNKRSAEYFGQLAAYENCLKEISAKPVVKILHYPVSGWVVRVD